MRISKRWHRAALALAVASAALASGIAAAQPSTGETRARAMVAAMSAGDPQGFERAAQENYSPAALARRTPEQRAQTVRQMAQSLGALQIADLKESGDIIIVTVHSARGGDAVFTFALGAPPERRIESLSIQTQRPLQPARTDNPYAPYAFLIGDWDTVPKDTSMVAAIRQTLHWGPQNTYIGYSAYTRAPGETQDRLHAEGVMTYNAQHKNLDFLFAHEPGTFGEEQGTLHIEPDGSVVRESTEVEGDGSLSHARQIFRPTGANTIVTSLLQQRPDGAWTPAFPGSDNLLMTRR